MFPFPKLFSNESVLNNAKSTRCVPCPTIIFLIHVYISVVPITNVTYVSQIANMEPQSVDHHVPNSGDKNHSMDKGITQVYNNQEYNS